MTNNTTKLGTPRICPLCGMYNRSGLVLPKECEWCNGKDICKVNILGGSAIKEDKNTKVSYNILSKIVALSTEELPNDFTLTEVNKRVWESFNLGRKFQKEVENGR